MGDSYIELKGIVDAIEADYYKAEQGNAAAGTRVRKAMQEVKVKAQAIRIEVQERKNSQ